MLMCVCSFCMMHLRKNVFGPCEGVCASLCVIPESHQLIIGDDSSRPLFIISHVGERVRESETKGNQGCIWIVLLKCGGQLVCWLMVCMCVCVLRVFMSWPRRCFLPPTIPEKGDRRAAMCKSEHNWYSFK